MNLPILSRGMSQDEQFYPDPEAFRPERFLVASGQAEAMDPKIFVFGFGRRYVSCLSENQTALIRPTACAQEGNLQTPVSSWPLLILLRQ